MRRGRKTASVSQLSAPAVMQGGRQRWDLYAAGAKSEAEGTLFMNKYRQSSFIFVFINVTAIASRGCGRRKKIFPRTITALPIRKKWHLEGYHWKICNIHGHNDQNEMMKKKKKQQLPGESLYIPLSELKDDIPDMEESLRRRVPRGVSAVNTRPVNSNQCEVDHSFRSIAQLARTQLTQRFLCLFTAMNLRSLTTYLYPTGKSKTAHTIPRTVPAEIERNVTPRDREEANKVAMITSPTSEMDSNHTSLRSSYALTDK